MTQVTMTTQRTAALDAATRQEIIRVCVEASGEADFNNLFSYLPPEGLHVMAYADRLLVGHAVVTTRWLQPENLPLLRTAYVDAVATAPKHQGQGVGSAVMRHLAEAIKDDFEIACLETEKVGFYEQVGWERWRGTLAGRERNGDIVPTPDQDGIMILRLPRTPALNLEGLLTIEIDGRIW